ncbi:hypothetical protein [Pedobacter jeongneungensis]
MVFSTIWLKPFKPVLKWILR